MKQNFTPTPENPRKVLKIVLTLSVVLLVLWLFLVSRMDYNTPAEPQNPVVEQRADSVRSLLQREKQQYPGTVDSRSSNIFSNAFTTFLVLIVLLGLVWLWVRKKTPNEVSKKSYKQIGGQMLGQGAELKIIEINDEIWVLGVTANEVNLLHRYPKNEWKEQDVTSDENPNSFYQLFSKS